MEMLNRLKSVLPTSVAADLEQSTGTLTEVRMRAGQPVQLVDVRSNRLVGPALEADAIHAVLTRLLEYSVYAHERDLDEGFFTLADGCRVGVCGRMVRRDGDGLSLAGVGSLCVRIARAVPNCALELVDRMVGDGRVRSTLIVSPPGMGKTTLLRDAARLLSERGWCVGIADERHEIAACHAGRPALDVGPRTDVIDGAPKAMAVRRLVRSMAPQIVVTDEIGGLDDAEALADARRCGVTVLASAHAEDFRALRGRKALREMLSERIFDVVGVLGGAPGQIRELLCRGEDDSWHYV